MNAARTILEAFEETYAAILAQLDWQEQSLQETARSWKGEARMRNKIPFYIDIELEERLAKILPKAHFTDSSMDCSVSLNRLFDNEKGWCDLVLESNGCFYQT